MKGITTRWRFGVQTEADHPSVMALLNLWNTRGRKNWVSAVPKLTRATLYVPHLSSVQDVADGATKGIDPLGDSFFTVDVRGMGESQSLAVEGGNERFLTPYGGDFFCASHGLMLAESYLGRRLHDLLCTLDVLAEAGNRSIHLAGRGMGAVLAALAGCLHSSVKQVTLKNALLSFHELTQTPVVAWPQSMMPWAGLTHFDLPDCYRALQRKGLRLVEPWDARMRPWRADKLREHLKALGITPGPR